MECEHVRSTNTLQDRFTLCLDQASPRFVARMPYSDSCQVGHPVTLCIPLNRALCTRWPSQKHMVHNTARLFSTLVKKGEAHVLHMQHTQWHRALTKEFR